MSGKVASSANVPIFEEKDDMLSCASYRGVKLLKHPINFAKRVLEMQIKTLINLNRMEFGFMSGKETVDAILVVRKMSEVN